ncbi:acyl-CoA dehydrogenase family protein [Kitasatospora sp. NPDC002040]|uniref:acyl-CoA dehydrogenase family protein n=1 Tax=Kitasatospora sp. NPDC002040 TaxID=3154661 RepID=UPI003317D3F1
MTTVTYDTNGTEAGTGALPGSSVRAAAQCAGRYAQFAQQERTLHPEVHAALVHAGFARHFAPQRLGGAGGGFAELLAAVALVGEECASAAWWASLQAAHARLAGQLPEAARNDIWGDGPDPALAAAVVPPAGELTPVPGGALLSGRWSAASGVDHAQWVLLAVPGREPGIEHHRVLVVPRADIRVHDSWYTSGMRGTGSRTLSVDGVFVPEHRIMARTSMARGSTEPGADHCHRLPYQLVAALLFAAPALGAARGALRAWTDLTRQRLTPQGASALAGADAQDLLARSSGRIDAAGLLLERAARRADSATPDPAAVALNLRDVAAAVDLLVEAVEQLLRRGGLRAQTEDCPLQRHWRDIHAIAAHAALQPATAAEAYGALVLAEG